MRRGQCVTTYHPITKLSGGLKYIAKHFCLHECKIRILLFSVSKIDSLYIYTFSMPSDSMELRWVQMNSTTHAYGVSRALFTHPSMMIERSIGLVSWSFKCSCYIWTIVPAQKLRSAVQCLHHTDYYLIFDFSEYKRASTKIYLLTWFVGKIHDAN